MTRLYSVGYADCLNGRDYCNPDPNPEQSITQEYLMGYVDALVEQTENAHNEKERFEARQKGRTYSHSHPAKKIDPSAI